MTTLHRPHKTNARRGTPRQDKARQRRKRLPGVYLPLLHPDSSLNYLPASYLAVGGGRRRLDYLSYVARTGTRCNDVF